MTHECFKPSIPIGLNACLSEISGDSTFGDKRDKRRGEEGGYKYPLFWRKKEVIVNSSRDGGGSSPVFRGRQVASGISGGGVSGSNFLDV